MATKDSVADTLANLERQARRGRLQTPRMPGYGIELDLSELLTAWCGPEAYGYEDDELFAPHIPDVIDALLELLRERGYLRDGV